MESVGVTPDFWRGRRVFVTGHTGFKGSWLCIWLHAVGADIAGYGLEPPTQPNLFSAARVADFVNDQRGDICDVAKMQGLLQRHRSEVVIHFAAQSLVRRSYESPIETFRTNVLGTAAVLEAIRATSGVRAAIIVTSDKCYDLTDASARHVETDPLGGDDPYSASKAAAEHVTSGFRSSFWTMRDENAPVVATVRSGNVVGGGDWSRDRLLPDLIRAFESGRAALIRRPEAVRPWQHVLDPLCGYLTLAQQLFGEGGADLAGAWNFGPPAANEWTVGAIADETAHLHGSSASWTIDAAQHPREAPGLRLDSTKARTVLGWQARINLPDALKRTVEWHKKFVAGEAARTLVDADIRELARHVVGS